MAPDFRIRTLDGRVLDLGALTARGPLVLDFWATWCRPCVAALPALDALARRWAPRGVTVLGISIDGPRNMARVRPFVNKLGVGYPVAIDDDGALQERFQVVAVPTTLVIGSDRRIAMERSGDGTVEEAERTLRTLLGADSAAAAPDTGTAR